MRSRSNPVVLGALLVLIAGSALAGGSSGALRLTWRAPDGCPGQQRVVADVDRLLPPGFRGRETVEAVAEISRAEVGSFRLRLSTRRATAEGTRELEHTSCESLASAAALILAVTLDPSLGIGPPESAGSGSAPSGASTGVPSSAPPSTSSSVSPLQIPEDAKTAISSGSAGSLGLGLGADVGTVPTFGLGVTAFAAWRLGLIELGGDVGFWSAPRKYWDASRGYGADFWLAEFGVAACARFGRGDYSAGPCAGAELDLLHGKGTGIPNPADASSTFVAPRAGAMLEARLTDRIVLRGQVMAVFPVPRDRFHLGESGFHQPSLVAVRTLVGASMNF